MKVETEFNIDDYVYFRDDRGKVCRGRIREIEVEFKKILDKRFNRGDFRPRYTVETIYTLHVPRRWDTMHSHYAFDMFRTRHELLTSEREVFVKSTEK